MFPHLDEFSDELASDPYASDLEFLDALSTVKREMFIQVETDLFPGCKTMKAKFDSGYSSRHPRNDDSDDSSTPASVISHLPPSLFERELVKPSLFERELSRQQLATKLCSESVSPPVVDQQSFVFTSDLIPLVPSANQLPVASPLPSVISTIYHWMFPPKITVPDRPASRRSYLVD